MRVLLPLLGIWFAILFLKGFHPSAPDKQSGPSVDWGPVKAVPDPSVAGQEQPVVPRSFEKHAVEPGVSETNLQSEFEIQIPVPEDRRVVSRSYRWNTSGVRRQELQSGEVSFNVAMQDLNRQIASFGVPEDTMQFSVHPADRDRVLQWRREAFAKRGILSTNNTLKPDYRWMIRHGQYDIYPVSRLLLASFQRKTGRGTRDLMAYVSGFVQDLEYRIPEATRNLPWDPTQRVFTGGVHMPLETLYNGWGDCDSKSVLLASLFANLLKAGTVFIEGNRHVFLGVAGHPGRNDHFIRYRNINYLLIEATSRWPIGRIPNENWHALHANQLKVYPVN